MVAVPDAARPPPARRRRFKPDLRVMQGKVSRSMEAPDTSSLWGAQPTPVVTPK